MCDRILVMHEGRITGEITRRGRRDAGADAASWRWGRPARLRRLAEAFWRPGTLLRGVVDRKTLKEMQIDNSPSLPTSAWCSSCSAAAWPSAWPRWRTSRPSGRAPASPRGRHRDAVRTGCAVLVANRDTPEEGGFRRSPGGGPGAPGRLGRRGGPRRTGRASALGLWQASPKLDAIAATPAVADWVVLQDMGRKFPALGDVPVVDAARLPVAELPHRRQPAERGQPDRRHRHPGGRYDRSSSSPAALTFRSAA